MSERVLYPDEEQRRRIMDFIMAAGQTLLENGAVFQQRLACRHNKIHNAAALFLIGIKNPLAHRRPPYIKVINDTALFYHVRNWRTRGK